MQDIKLLETCGKCGANLTLMESQRHPEGDMWLVKRCLECGGHPVEEVVKLLSNIKPTYTINSIPGLEDSWIATEKHPDDGTLTGRMEFHGYGKTPEEAFKNIESAHQSFNEAMWKT